MTSSSAPSFPSEHAGSTLQGHYRDVLRGADGTIIEIRPWRSNAIVVDCRRLLAAFVHGPPAAALGIQGLLLGAGLAAWDSAPPPPPSGNETTLVDPNPFLVPAAGMTFDFLTPTNAVSPSATNRLQLGIPIGPGMPSWPDGDHATANLREFGLVGQLDGSPVLLNYVIHPVIAKDPTSTLDRTIWLVF